MVTIICDDDDVELHPATVAVTIDVPIQAADHVTVPVEVFIEFPPVILAASRVYVTPVAFVAVAV